MNSVGEMQWSCCLAKSRQAFGCIDENSIGIRSRLAFVKPTFSRPNSAHGKELSKLSRPSTANMLSSSSKHIEKPNAELNLKSILSQSLPKFPAGNSQLQFSAKTSVDIMQPQSSVFSSALIPKRNIGKIRADFDREFAPRNRPMSSGYDYQMQRL